ncbi:MAG: glucosyl hydrolase family protein [uncultured bacterium]|nr:MAG: glucosyl hydrolase family protein [uncultured bacterium]
MAGLGQWALLLMVQPALAVDTQPASASFEFVRTALLDPSGGIYANYLTNYPNDPDAGVNHQMLSEYAGIAMEYAVFANDQDFFATQAAFVKTYLQNHVTQPELDLYSWRINETLNTPANASATIDDFRIIDGYLQAASKWGNSDYRTTALAAAADLRSFTMVDGYISEAASWDADGVYASDTAILSYFDLPAMQRLAEFDSTWTAIEQTHYDLIADSATALANNGLYWLYYNLNTGIFIQQSSLNTIHQAIIAQQLAEAGHTELAQQSLDFYKNEYNTNDGVIYGAYTPQGVAASPYEDISIYGIVASTALYLGDDNFANQLFDKITSLQVAGTGTIYDGAFLWSNPDRVYAFVQLQALRALAQAHPVPYVPEPIPEPDPVNSNPAPLPNQPTESQPEPEPTPTPTPTPTTDDPVTAPSDDTASDPSDEIADVIVIHKVRYNPRTHKLVVWAASSSSDQVELWITNLGELVYQPRQQQYRLVKRIKQKKLPTEIMVISSRGGSATKVIDCVRHRLKG